MKSSRVYGGVAAGLLALGGLTGFATYETNIEFAREQATANILEDLSRPEADAWQASATEAGNDREELLIITGFFIGTAACFGAFTRVAAKMQCEEENSPQSNRY